MISGDCRYRWGKGKAAGGAPRISTGDPIQFDVVGGRTTAIVPSVQHKGLLKQADIDAKRTCPKAGKKRKDASNQSPDFQGGADDAHAPDVKAVPFPLTMSTDTDEHSDRCESADRVEGGSKRAARSTTPAERSTEPKSAVVKTNRRSRTSAQAGQGSSTAAATGRRQRMKRQHLVMSMEQATPAAKSPPVKALTSVVKTVVKQPRSGRRRIRDHASAQKAATESGPNSVRRSARVSR